VILIVSYTHGTRGTHDTLPDIIIILMPESILEVKNLTKQFGSFTAVDSISFSLKKGKVLGFLGPNGAGKTTTIHMLIGVTTKTSGDIEYFGKEFYKNRQYCLQRINFASAFNTLLGRISVMENLLVFAQLYSVKNPKNKINELLEYFEITQLADQRYWDLSAGQRTRVNIVKSLINDPELLLLDEPTASLDPDIADKTLTLIEDLKKTRRISILFTSHNMDEVTRICDEVIFLHDGKIVVKDTPLNLTKKVGTAQLQLTFEGSKKDFEDYLKKHENSYTFLNKNIILIDTEEKQIPKLIFGISKTDIYITDIEVKKPTLEDVFLDIARNGGKNVDQ
jgi:ABC-2 type transport system ATP-binding protein